MLRMFGVFVPTESSDESSLATSPLRHRLPQSMKIVHEIMYKVEVLYVLCVLLMGRQRNQVRWLPGQGWRTRPGAGSGTCLTDVTALCRCTRCWLSFV